jgi:acyl-coenzyme A thioesterase PaaI-like protein
MARLPIDPHEIYVTGDPAEDEPRARKHELVRQTKRAVEDVALLDVSGVDDDELVGLIDDMRAIADRLAKLPSLRDRGGLASAPYPDSALLERSGIAGRSNPLASPLHMWFEGDAVRGWAVYSDPYEGPAGCLHGGFIAAAFDDLMGFAQMASGRAGYTGTLTVKMRRPTPLHRRLDYAAGVDRVEGRKIWVWGTCHDGDELLSEAEIVFISPRDGSVPR